MCSQISYQNFTNNEMNALEWPSQRPDLSPVENLWAEQKSCVWARWPTNYQTCQGKCAKFSTNTYDLFKYTKNVWKVIKQYKYMTVRSQTYFTDQKQKRFSLIWCQTVRKQGNVSFYMAYVNIWFPLHLLNILYLSFCIFWRFFDPDEINELCF